MEKLNTVPGVLSKVLLWRVHLLQLMSRCQYVLMKPVFQSRGLSLTLARPSFRPQAPGPLGCGASSDLPGWWHWRSQEAAQAISWMVLRGTSSLLLLIRWVFGRRPWRQGLLITSHHGHVVSAQVVPGGIDRVTCGSFSAFILLFKAVLLWPFLHQQKGKVLDSLEGADSLQPAQN